VDRDGFQLTRAFQELEKLAQKDSAAIEAFLEGRTLPIVEGRSVTFLWQGEADDVRLRHWIYGMPSSQSFRRLPGTDLWHLTIDLPEGSRVEYKLAIVRGESETLIEDPRNPVVARDPFGANSVCHVTGYETPAWTLPDPEARPGILDEIVLPSRALDGPRRVIVYLPARFRRTRSYPLLVVHDGEDYLRYASLRIVLDNLIHRLEVAPMIVAFTQSPRRHHEYTGDRAHARFLTEELLPEAARRFSLVDRPGARGLMGASFGAVASLATAWMFPGVWGRLFLQSGSFAFTDIGENRRGPVFEPIVRFMNRFREAPTRCSERVFVSCGMYESLIYENRSLVPLLQETGMAVRFVEARDGHNWENWRDRQRAGLSWLFPGPLWMMYE